VTLLEKPSPRGAKGNEPVVGTDTPGTTKEILFRNLILAASVIGCATGQQSGIGRGGRCRSA
jgi:hypothetical protein